MTLARVNDRLLARLTAAVAGLAWEELAADYEM
jgi:hypothetical protein